MQPANPSASPQVGRVCERHGLRVATDGRCVLCRREALEQASAQPSRVVALSLFGLILVGLGFLGTRLLPSESAVVAQAEPLVTSAVRTAQSPPDPVPRGAGQGRAAEVDLPPVPDERPFDAARALRDVPVTIYTTSWCGYCQKARALLSQNGVGFVEHDIEQEPDARDRAHRLNPGGGVPVLDIDGEVLIGFNPQGIASSLSSALTRRRGRPVEISFVP